MKKAALYARVSSASQEKDRTIESQIAALKRQIATAGDVLVKEYVDDGFSGSRLDRPAMDRLRDDLKSNAFDSVYFLGTDRIARDVVYQNVIIGEILKHGKQLVVGGRDFAKSPENDFTLTVLGAAAQLERAKIMERNQRGKMHCLRQGLIHSNGHNTFGYDYILKSPGAPARCVINEREAKVVKYIFRAYAEEGASWTRIIRYLEDSGATTKTGKRVWCTVNLRAILKNHSYAGTKYFNSRYCEKKSSDPLRPVRYGRKVYRDRSEWIPIKVPAIITQKLFDKAQVRRAAASQVYRRPKETRLLSGLVRCGECGSLFTSYYRTYRDSRRKTDPERVFHKRAYRCTRVIQQRLHSKKADIRRCGNSEVLAHLLEGRMLDMIRETMTDPDRLEGLLDPPKDAERARRRTEARLKALEAAVGRLAQDKNRIVDLYVKGRIGDAEYARLCRKNDGEAADAKARRAKMLSLIPTLHKRDAVAAGVRLFCESVRTDIIGNADGEARRKSLREYVEKITFDRGRITIASSVPVRSATRRPEAGGNADRIPFVIEGTLRQKQASG